MRDEIEFPFFGANWSREQDQWAKAFASFWSLMPTPPSAHPGGDDGAEQWYGAPPFLSAQHADFYEKVAQQSKTFFFIGQQFKQFCERVARLNKTDAAWQDKLNEQFKAMQTFMQTVTPADVSSFLGMTEGDKHGELTGISAFIDKLLSIPMVGRDREMQTMAQQGARLLREYQCVYQEFNAELNGIGVEALEKMRLKIIEMAERGEKLESLREVYNLWVDCSEAVYAEHANSDEYSALFGRLVNTLMLVKQHNGKVMDKILSKLNIPTRQGMNTALQRLQTIKRVQARSDARIARLEEELETIKKLLAQKPKSAMPASPTKKKASKKKTTRKKVKTAKKVAKKTKRKTSKKKITGTR